MALKVQAAGATLRRSPRRTSSGLLMPMRTRARGASGSWRPRWGRTGGSSAGTIIRSPCFAIPRARPRVSPSRGGTRLERPLAPPQGPFLQTAACSSMRETSSRGGRVPGPSRSHTIDPRKRSSAVRPPYREPRGSRSIRSSSSGARGNVAHRNGSDLAGARPPWMGGLGCAIPAATGRPWRRAGPHLGEPVRALGASIVR